MLDLKPEMESSRRGDYRACARRRPSPFLSQRLRKIRQQKFVAEYRRKRHEQKKMRQPKSVGY